jgi:hypothetical protein
MKIKFSFLAPALLLVGIVLLLLTAGFIGPHETLYGGGAPSGYTGSPGDSKVCTQCHSGPTATDRPGWISTNVPDTGYTPGSTYTITVTAEGTGHTVFGFLVSPQKSDGTLQGTLINTSEDTQLTGNNKYVTQTLTGKTGSGSRVWNFDWTAPQTGSGSITFYGAFNIANANNSSSGDTIYTSTLDVPEAIQVGSPAFNNLETGLSIFPNPAGEQVQLQYTLASDSRITVKLYDLQGRLVQVIGDGHRPAGSNTEPFSLDRSQLPGGIYLLAFSDGSRMEVRKIELR